MKTVFLYLPPAMADHETGYLLQGLAMQKLLPEPRYSVRTAGAAKEAVRTLGGLTITPDCTLDEIGERGVAALILPGADSWQEPEQHAVLRLAVRLLERGVPVAAICGATLGLADAGALNGRRHTSNAPFFLPAMSKHYSGGRFYVDEPAVADGDLITAGSAGGLLWAKLILERLGLYSQETLEAWYRYFLTGDVRYYEALMGSFQTVK